MNPSQPNTRHPAPLAATAIIGLGTLASLAMGVIANKVYALVLGPEGVGVIALILPALAVGALVAGLGTFTSVVPLVSASLASGEGARAETTKRIARRITLGASLVLVLTVVLFRENLAVWIFGTASDARFLLFVGPAIMLTSLAYLETGILTGHDRIREIAFANALTAVIGAVAGVAAVMAFGLDGIPPALLVSAAAHLTIVRIRTRRIAGDGAGARGSDREIAGNLLRLGVPAAISQLVVVGAQLLIPVLILHRLGEHEVGFYRAASTISIAYLTVVLSTLAYEFLPRIARLQSHEIGPAIDQHMRLLLGIAVPLILGLFALGPLVIELLFSNAFVPAISVLQWQLVGDLLRLPAWALAFALIARSRGGVYLALEGIVGASLIVAVPIGLQLGGLEGVGIGYAVAQGTYLLAAWAITSRLGITAPGRLQGAVVFIALVASGSIVADVPLVARGVLFGGAAIALAAVAIPRLYTLYRAVDQ